MFGTRHRVQSIPKLLQLVMVAALGCCALIAASAPAQAATRTFVSVDVTADGQGYGLMASSGELYAYGSSTFLGNPTGFSGRIVGASYTADGKGYVAVSSSGQVYAYGTAVYRGNPSGFSGSITGISVTADGQGYIVISSAGQTYAYGTVVSRGNPTGFTGSMVGISVTGDGQGYAAISSIGQVYAYGTVVSRGNPTGFTNGIVGIAVTANGQGYVAVSGSGQAYAYGTVRYWGNGDPGGTSISAVRAQIASLANAQVNNATRNKEAPLGSNCNFYTTAFGVAPSGSCSNQWAARAWCADFSRWVWQNAGANVSGINGLAASFKTYGDTRGTWHSGVALTGIQVGDAIVYNQGTAGTGDDHVNIVIGINGNVLTLAGGNQSDKVTTWTLTKGASTVGGKIVSGYSSPVL